MERVEAVGHALVDDRYLLADDLPAILDRAGRHWDLLNGDR